MAGTARDQWFRRFDDGPVDGVRLVCFPHAGGAASSYLQLSKDLSPAMEIWSVQYPGRQDRHREEHFGTIQQLARRIADAVGDLADRPLALFGHSMGAIAAFEVARLLEDGGGSPPVALFVSGRRAPSTRREERVHLRDDNGLIEEIRSLNGTDVRVLANEEILRMILPAVRADYRATETYTYLPGPPLSVPVVALVGESDPRATLNEVRAWEQHTAGGFELHVLQGGHFFLSAHRSEVARIVVDSLRLGDGQPVRET